MVSDQEPRYRLVDSDGNIVGSLYGKPDGSVAIQETASGADREVALAPDGTFSAPSVETESVSTESLVDDRNYAGAFGGSDPDERLDNALSAASDGDVIYLERDRYLDNRTVSTSVTIIGTNSNTDDGTVIEADWTLDSINIHLANVGINGFNVSGDVTLELASRVTASNIELRTDGGVVVTGNDVVIYGVMTRGSDNGLTFESDTSGGVVDTSTDLSITDNGNNLVGDVT